MTLYEQYIAKDCETLRKMQRHFLYKLVAFLGGIITLVISYVVNVSRGTARKSKKVENRIIEEMIDANVKNNMFNEIAFYEKNKNKHFGIKMSDSEFQKKVDKQVEKKFKAIVEERTRRSCSKEDISKDVFDTLHELLKNKLFFIFSFIVSLPMYLLVEIYKNAYAKYIFERLLMVVFVVFGVISLVFTILYISPMNAAANILGEGASPQQIAEFNAYYGLDRPYLVQLADTIKNIFSFNLGKAFVGNEDIFLAISRKFPITMQLAFLSLLVSIGIAIPSGIISAIKQYSGFDYVFMIIALLGLSIPNFWLGLVLILNFSIKLKWLPAIFIPGNLATLIMPAIVLGTALSATVARMTRSSMLEVKNQDYILTARAKGLNEKRVILKHILGNAMVTIITVIGLQFGSMLGGAAVTEKVFSVNGIGSYIVDKQFIPDIPVVLAGVVYVSIVISLINLIVDIAYAFIDPRIKTKIKNY